jgi:chaperonin GroES
MRRLYRCYHRSMKIRPLHDRLIVHRLDEGEQRVGGIIIPDSAKEKPQQGTVIAAGSGKAKAGGKRTTLDVKVGDDILFGKYSGQEIRLDGQEYFIMKEEDVLAIIDRPTRTSAVARATRKATKHRKPGTRHAAKKKKRRL